MYTWKPWDAEITSISCHLSDQVDALTFCFRVAFTKKKRSPNIFAIQKLPIPWMDNKLIRKTPYSKKKQPFQSISNIQIRCSGSKNFALAVGRKLHPQLQNCKKPQSSGTVWYVKKMLPLSLNYIYRYIYIQPKMLFYWIFAYQIQLETPGTICFKESNIQEHSLRQSVRDFHRTSQHPMAWNNHRWVSTVRGNDLSVWCANEGLRCPKQRFYMFAL